MGTLTRKGYGRIYVDTVENIDKVKEIIKEMDEFEYDYLPKDLITVYTDYPNVCYTHKFDALDMDKLTGYCWSMGIRIWAFDAGHNEFPSVYLNNLKLD